jgi:hypothetical protein
MLKIQADPPIAINLSAIPGSILWLEYGRRIYTYESYEYKNKSHIGRLFSLFYRQRRL